MIFLCANCVFQYFIMPFEGLVLHYSCERSVFFLYIS